MKAVTSAGEPLPGVAPKDCRRSRTSGWRITCWISAFRRATTSDGVPAGRAIAQSLMDEAADLRIPARIDRIGLFESLTGGGPARYEPLEIVQLG